MNNKISKQSEELLAMLGAIVKLLTLSNFTKPDNILKFKEFYDDDKFKSLSEKLYLNIKYAIENNENGAEEIGISIFEEYYNTEREFIKYLQGFRNNVSERAKNNEIEYEVFSEIADFIDLLYERTYKIHSLTEYLYWLLIDNYAKNNNKRELEEYYCKKNKALDRYRLERLKYQSNKDTNSTSFQKMLKLYYEKSKKQFDGSFQRTVKSRFKKFLNIVEENGKDSPKIIKGFISDLNVIKNDLNNSNNLSNEIKVEILSKIDAHLVKLPNLIDFESK